MNEPQRDILRDHEYDGIREFDNPTPGWWHLVFWTSVVFSFGYFFFFHISPVSWTVAELYDENVAADLRLQFSEIGELEPTENTLVRFMNEEKWLKVGAVVFQAQCVSCHGKDGSGLVGPNLTDERYKQVRTLTDIARIVAEGAAEGAMPAWKSRLHPNELVLVSAYVATMRGLDLPGRQAEGDEILPWPTAAAAGPAEGESGASPAPASGGEEGES